MLTGHSVGAKYAQNGQLFARFKLSETLSEVSFIESKGGKKNQRLSILTQFLKKLFKLQKVILILYTP